jgi:hypothetical protein
VRQIREAERRLHISSSSLSRHGGVNAGNKRAAKKSGIFSLEMGNGQFDPYLPQSSGYAIIIGGGFGFALFMLVLSWLQSKFTETSPFESEFLRSHTALMHY